MGDLILSSIDKDQLIEQLSERITVKVLRALESKETPLDSEATLLTVQKAATFLNLSIATIYSKCSRKEIPFMKRGKRLYFSKQELTDYLKKGKVLSNDELNDRLNEKS